MIAKQFSHIRETILPAPNKPLKILKKIGLPLSFRRNKNSGRRNCVCLSFSSEGDKLILLDSQVYRHNSQALIVKGILTVYSRSKV